MSQIQVSLDYYQRLEVPEFSDLKTIQNSFRALALKWHPDRHPLENKKAAEEKFKSISEAYEVLTKRKLEYDNLLRQVRQPRMEVVFEYSFEWAGGWTHSAASNSTTGATFF